jgi:large subunit ribosomal protein L9
MENQLLLLEDVQGLGRKGDIVKPKPGFARNYLVPQRKGVVVTSHTLRMRAKLQEEREKQARIDRVESEALAKVIDGQVLSVEVKVDPAGHMYGSVSVQDIVKLFEEQGVTIDRHYVLLVHPIKVTGEHTIELRLKEGIMVKFLLRVLPEGGVLPQPERATVEVVQESAPGE